jgi:hypothetical protein
MNYRGETVKMVVPPGNRPAVPRDWTRGVPVRYVAGADIRGRQEGRPYNSRSLRSVPQAGSQFRGRSR